MVYATSQLFDVFFFFFAERNRPTFMPALSHFIISSQIHHHPPTYTSPQTHTHIRTHTREKTQVSGFGNTSKDLHVRMFSPWETVLISSYVLDIYVHTLQILTIQVSNTVW